MKIQTDYYGEVEYDQEDLVTISGGFFGFSELTYYLPICLSEDEGSLLLMQSTEQPDIAFVIHKSDTCVLVCWLTGLLVGVLVTLHVLS